MSPTAPQTTIDPLGAFMTGAFARPQTEADGFSLEQRKPMPLVATRSLTIRVYLSRQLVGIADRSSAAVAQRLKPVLLVAIEDFVAGLAGYAELPTDLCHGLPIQQPGNETKRSSITELSFHGIAPSVLKKRKV